MLLLFLITSLCLHQIFHNLLFHRVLCPIAGATVSSILDARAVTLQSVLEVCADIPRDIPGTATSIETSQIAVQSNLSIVVAVYSTVTPPSPLPVNPFQFLALACILGKFWEFYAYKLICS